ncbi:hypothetical protein ACFQ71_32425 [Streptomyces sp. NPDC056534]|uniref:hypothetical protein n=1 Tax=Streptomyces sp. NPDC056534 TaxID=3345857 RepID=UPI00369E21D2
MGGDATYQNITATVRPPRCAIFINGKSEHWKAAVDGAIAKASEVWGGRHFLIIPTDGLTIADKFWELLETYSPDHLAVFNLTFNDLEDSDPERYQERKGIHREAWKAEGHPEDAFEDWFTGSADYTRVDGLEISEGLGRQLIYRLSPFHFTQAIDTRITRKSGFGYPFTKIAKIITGATRHMGLVRLPSAIEDPNMKLLVHSETGIVSEDHYADAGFVAKSLPDSYDILEILKYLAGARLASSSDDAEPKLDGDFLPNTPFGLSMLHLGQYYRADRHMDYAEPVVVVLGDTVEGFCLYYSLSRMHEGVRWLPLEWLRASIKALNARRACRERGEREREFTQIESAGRALSNVFYELIKYGHNQKRLQLCSMSLNRRQLIAHRTQIARCSYFRGEMSSHIDCVSIDSVSTNCILRVFEVDNYVNHRSMVFLDGKSVSPFETPSVKNFSNVRLGEHYWLTSLRVEGYQPPSSPELGPKIVKLHGSTTESRVAADGIVYQCPNSMIFSSELDAVLVRPKIELPDEMALFGSYFEAAGVTVKYSDKGKYFMDTLRRFGDLDTLAKFIKSPDTRDILDKFTWTKKQARDIHSSAKPGERGSVIYLGDNSEERRCYLNLNALTLSMGSEESAASLVDDLVGKRIIERGYIFGCQRCDASAWYSFELLSNEFVCVRCGLHQQFTVSHWREPALPHWYYRLAETVRLFYVNNSHLTALALFSLKARSKTAFHFVPEMDLVGFPGSSGKREMDIACILDGDVIFGECKTEPLQAKDVAKFVTLLGMPVKPPSKIVFATTRDVSDPFNAQAQKLGNAEILTGADLMDF